MTWGRRRENECKELLGATFKFSRFKDFIGFLGFSHSRILLDTSSLSLIPRAHTFKAQNKKKPLISLSLSLTHTHTHHNIY